MIMCVYDNTVGCIRLSDSLGSEHRWCSVQGVNICIHEVRVRIYVYSVIRSENIQGGEDS